MADASAAMAVDEVQIDEALYSRQLYVLGHEAMRRMAGATVLIVGLKGLGVEIAKNVVLAGVKSVTLHDDAPVALSDLSAQFFLTEADVGKPRAEVTAPRLAELNQYTPVARSTEALTPALCASFGIVVLTGVPPAEAVAINEACRGAGARFIMTDTFGVFGAVFCDFGDAFTVYDTNGEEPLSAMVSSISQEEEGLVTVLDEGRHGLEDGDFVTFTEVKGMAELNGCEPKQVKVKGPYTFTIDDTRGCCKYECGGYMHQVKQHKTLSFKSLAASLAAPEFLLSDFAKFDRPMQLHLGFQALHAYRAEHGSLPAPSDAAAAAELLARAKAIGQAAGGEAAECEFSDRLLRNLASGSRGELSPMCAFFGGIVGQEVMKAASGKFTPVQQWMYFDAEESLPGGGADGLSERVLESIHHIVVPSWEELTAPQQTVFVSIPSLLDPSLAPAGRHVLHAYVPATEPYEVWEGMDRRSDEYKALKAERAAPLWRAIERFIPDIRERAEVTMVGSPLTHERFLRRHRGTYGPELRAGERGFPSAYSKVDGLLLCGDSTFPGIGVPAVAGSGIAAAHAVSGVAAQRELLREMDGRGVLRPALP